MNWLTLFHSMMQVPCVASCVVQTSKWIDYLWLGHTAKYTNDDVIPVWYTNINRHCPCAPPPPPDFHPLSLKYVWYILLYSMGYTEYDIVNDWVPGLPNVCNDIVVLYYSRGHQWMAIVHSETDWKQFRESLFDWIEEHKGKQEDDASFNVISVLNQSKDDADITVQMFPFLSPSGDFVSKDHRDRLTYNSTDIYVTEDIEGNRTEI